ncbi:MAG: carboxypeptidase regulatory-like domain-containing protein [Actinomycetota bacterium]
MSKIYGVALTNDGSPVSGVAVELVDSGGEVSGSHTTKEDGIFEFEVTAGSWGLRWKSPQGRSDEADLDVVEGEDAEVELEIPL